MTMTTKSKTSSSLVDQINEGKDYSKYCPTNSFLFNSLQLFSGGSGVNVIGPPTSSDPNLFSQIQRNATQSGALHEGSGEPSSRRITIYRNGFTVDDGPLRDPHAPDNVQFIRDLGNGVVPAGVDLDP